MKIVRATIIILLFLTITYPISAYTLIVRVFDVDGNPIEDASVKVGYDERKTNTEGIAIMGIPQQYTVPLSVIVSKEGYETYSTIINPPYPTNLDVFLYSSEKDFIQGTVYINSTDNPAGGGYVIEVYDVLLNERIGFAVTDENSWFEFEVSIDRTCFLIVTGFPEQRFEAKPGEDIDIIIQTGKRPKTSILSHSGITFEPGSVIIVGSEANQMDGVVARHVGNALSTWISEADSRISEKVPEFKYQHAATNASILEQLESVDVVSDDTNQEKKGFFTVLVGGPEVNMSMLNYNTRLSTEFVEDQVLTNKWLMQDPGGCLYKDSEYGIIALIPMYPQLDDSAIYSITGGDKRLCMLVVAGNAREGTYAAGLILKGILQMGTEGQELLNELDKLLIWMFLGDEQAIQPVTIIVKYVGGNDASIVKILMGEDESKMPCFEESAKAPETSAKELPFEMIAKGYYGGLDERKNYVLKDNEDAENLKDKGYSLPAVDFTHYMVIAVFQGTGGFDINVSKVVETEDNLQVLVKEIWPGKKCEMTNGLTKPYYIIKIQKTEKEAVFIVGKEIMICPPRREKGKGTLSGRVIDPDSGSGIHCATVRLSPFRGGTDMYTLSSPDGRFTFSDLDPGTYTVWVYWRNGGRCGGMQDKRSTMESHGSNEGEITVKDGETSTTTIELGSSGNHFEITRVSINGGGDVISVSPGEKISVEIEFIYWVHESCLDCVTYFPVGIGSDPQDSIFGGIFGVYPGSCRSGTVYLTAPSEPGEYSIHITDAVTSNKHQSFETYTNRYPEKVLRVGYIRVIEEARDTNTMITRDLIHRFLVIVTAVLLGILVIWAFHHYEKKSVLNP